MNFFISAANNIIASLEILWKGMLGIFIVLGIIYLSIILLNKVTSGKKKEKPAEVTEEENSEEESAV
jgi:hypothetical protein